MALTVTVVDDADGSTETVTVPDGDYLLICVDPCHLHYTQAYANGTHILTVKGRRPQKQRSWECPKCSRITHHPDDVANEYCSVCGNDSLPKGHAWPPRR